MLSALYKLARQRGLVQPPGFALKVVKAYISLNRDGVFLDTVPGDDEGVLCPDIGSAAQGPDKCHPLAEKWKVVLADPGASKREFFCDMLCEGGKYEPSLLICLKALDTPEVLSAIRSKVEQLKLKDTDRISFRVSGKSILNSSAVQEWWGEYRRRFMKPPKSAALMPCLITGQPTLPMATVPPIYGLAVVGGHSKGDALICFDKPAFCSYGLEQSANAPVSEEAFAAVKASLDYLLADAPILGGMKFVHWYDRPIVRQEEDILNENFICGDEADDDDDGNDELEYDSVEADKARLQADKLIGHVKDGQQAVPLLSEYYILLLTGVNGRVMIRRYERGSYEQLQRNLAQWDEDLRLVRPDGVGYMKACKLSARFMRLINWQSVDKTPFDRMGKELSGIEPQVIMAIINGSALPDAVAMRALAYIRARIFDSADDGSERSNKSGNIPDARACQWLKAWLARRNRQIHREVYDMSRYNPEHPSVAYHCGALMCLYANIQARAMGDLNSNVIQRYYASACQTPGLVVGRMSMQSNHHLEKIENSYVRQRYMDEITRVACAIPDSIPATLDLTGQAEFALGYYHKQAEENEYLRQYNANRAAKRSEQAQTAENDAARE